MVKDVREDSTELHVYPLSDHDALLNAEVYVPEGLAAEGANTTVVTTVDSQDRVAEAVIDRLWVLIQRRPVTTPSHTRILRGRYGVIVSLAAASCTTADVDGVVVAAGVGAIRYA